MAVHHVWPQHDRHARRVPERARRHRPEPEVVGRADEAEGQQADEDAEACATHGARTQQCTAWKVHGVGVGHVWPWPRPR